MLSFVRVIIQYHQDPCLPAPQDPALHRQGYERRQVQSCGDVLYFQRQQYLTQRQRRSKLRSDAVHPFFEKRILHVAVQKTRRSKTPRMRSADQKTEPEP